MVFGNIHHLERDPGLGEAIKACFAYVESHDLASLDAGRYPIDGERLFVNVVEYETAPCEERFWEAHRAYLDVHVVLEGQEQIDVGFASRMLQGEYVKKDDFLPLEGGRDASVWLKPGEVLVCGPKWASHGNCGRKAGKGKKGHL